MRLCQSILALLILTSFNFNTHASVLDFGGGQVVSAELFPEAAEATPDETAAELSVPTDFVQSLQTINSARVQIVVSKAKQRMSVSVDGQTVYYWKVSTARAGYVTPSGTYAPYRMELMHYSKKYDNSPMPHSIFFRGGYAIHGTNESRNLGRPASHGCVRLLKANATALYALVQAYGPANTVITIY
jgi:lipoprotein-anchoring transpeptidase ErfK/SrfK